MSWKESCRSRLREHLDARGDLAPPWERFPDYERHTIGWRMGAGEDWMGMWSVFLEQLAPDPGTRIAYLRRHPPAPISWADAVHEVLYPAERGDDDGDEDEDDEPTAAVERRSALLEQGLIASDVAFATWLGQQTGVSWPWERSPAPEDAARYNTRELWFWSRQVAELRRGRGWAPPAVPAPWRACARALETGDAGAIDPQRGLLSLAQLLCAGHVDAPWQLGLSLADFADSFEDDMGYVDAFRLWGMSAFDDAEQLRRYLEATRMPPGWQDWVAEQLPVA
ncbi:hypothetical protein BE04_35610 [Sorangium cellulosum]|uniref:Uncharacterized protein n=2 Tax=Sorangium cellulosum TaxID=56 RepID=A0A150PTW8_SORCE|nr:hypothetical protein [Sorangium cellulosum]AGP38585.1 hypothetical protein SCE1572_31390 [Sorangium cellulosum So0157-2]KYF59165.1 hypothetical protein BE04_35610 [Sorangium cellulosum]